MDDHDARRRHGPRFSDTDSIFNWIHEGFTKHTAKNMRPVVRGLWTSGRGRQPRVCRSGKQNCVRLCHEPNGAFALAYRKILALGGCDLQVAAIDLNRLLGECSLDIATPL